MCQRLYVLRLVWLGEKCSGDLIFRRNVLTPSLVDFPKSFFECFGGKEMQLKMLSSSHISFPFLSAFYHNFAVSEMRREMSEKLKLLPVTKCVRKREPNLSFFNRNIANYGCHFDWQKTWCKRINLSNVSLKIK